MVVLEAFIAGIILSFAHYFGETLHKGIFSKESTISLAAGISVSYIFLSLFPEISATSSSSLIFISVLVGFSLFHLAEKIIYKHKDSKIKKSKEIHRLHMISFFIYHLLIGIVIVNIMTNNILSGVLFSIPIFFHSLVGSVSFEKLNSKIKDSLSLKIFLSLSTLFGVFIGFVYPFPEIYYIPLLGLVVGSMMFVVIKDSLPEGERGSPWWFIVGVFGFTVLMIILWNSGLATIA